MAKTYGSPSEVILKDMIEFQKEEFQIISSQLTDTLSPSTITLEASQIVLQLMIQNAEYTQKFGKNEKAEANAKQLKRLFELVSKFNSMVGDMNTLQLQNRNFYATMIDEKKKVISLEKKLQQIINAEEF